MNLHKFEYFLILKKLIGVLYTNEDEGCASTTSEQSDNEDIQVADLHGLNKNETNEQVLEDSNTDSGVYATIEQSD